jgi:hypothetical protein
LGIGIPHARLNSFSEEKIKRKAADPSASSRPAADPYYEVHCSRRRVQTRPDNQHDLSTPAWLAFPKTKARINAMHAADPAEGGKRGRLRDLLTIFDEGGDRRLRGDVAAGGAGAGASCSSNGR